MRNAEIIPLADSTILRFIDELNGFENVDDQIYELKREIKHLQKASDISPVVKKRSLKKKYERLNELQYKPDYVCLVVDNNKDYERAYRKGFTINGIKYSRLLATNGGVKNSVIVFTSERLKPELRRRIENGRNPNIPLVPAKYGAYEALACSSATPVSDPKGILVVKDCYTEFEEDVITLDNSDSDVPIMKEVNNYKIVKNCSDGYGTMTKERAEIWSEELGLDYVMSGCNTRYSWEKGMLVVFDHIAFVEQVAGASPENEDAYFVEDVWGHKIDVRTVDVILTESMLKLWNCYDSIEDYIENCHRNRYQFAIPKVTPKSLENMRSLNYQFIQSYHLTDDEIKELVSPTVKAIKDILHDDWTKTVLYAKGTNIDADNVKYLDDDCVKAMMIDPRMRNDPFVRNHIYKMIHKRIDEAKIGVLHCHGDYQIACGDPYALWQSICGLPVTGLLKKGEIYSKYWVDNGAENVVVFRAPMSCHNNLRRMKVARSKEMSYWYKGIQTMVIVNSWDTMTDACNGED